MSGTVINGTTREPVGGVEVIISRFDDPTNPESVDVTVSTATDGSFEVHGLDTSEGLAFVASVRYEDVIYSSDMILLSNEPHQTVELTVYETTADQGAITVRSRGIIVTSIDAERGIVSVTDVYSLDVAGDRAVVAGDDGRTVRFTLPESALEVTPGPGFHFGTPSVEGSTVFATSAVRPGTTSATLNYVLPYRGDTLSLPVTAEYPTETLRVLIPSDLADGEPVLSSTATAVGNLGVLPIEGREFHAWSSPGMEAGERLDLALSGLPRPSLEANRLRTVEPAAIAILAVVAASIATVWTVSKRGLNRPQAMAATTGVTFPLDVRREELANELRQLEADHSNGLVDDDLYRSERRAILEELRTISRRSRGLTDDE